MQLKTQTNQNVAIWNNLKEFARHKGKAGIIPPPDPADDWIKHQVNWAKGRKESLEAIAYLK